MSGDNKGDDKMENFLKVLKSFPAFLAVICLAFGNVSVLADGTDYTAVLSDYVRTFDESADVTSYVKLLGSESEGHFQSLYNDDGNMVLKLGGTADDVPKKNENSGGKVWSSTESEQRLELDFKAKSEAGNMGGFCVYIYTGEGKMSVLFALKNDAKKIYFLGNEIGGYEADIWYDINLKFDFSVGYACLSMKKTTETDWTTVYSAASETNNPYLTSWIPVSSSVKSISFSHYRNTAKDRSVTYIDDLMVNTWDNNYGAVDFMEDDFTAVSTVPLSSNEMLDSSSAWLLSGGTAAAQNGAAVLSADADASGKLFKKPFKSAPSAYQRIRFKFGVPQNGGEMTVGMSYNNPASSSTMTALGAAQSIPLVRVRQDKIILGGTEHSVDFEDGKMYACEIVYSAKDKIAALAVEASGVQYAGNGAAALEAVFGTGADWGYLSELALGISASADSASSVAFDDFNWDMGTSSYSSSSLDSEQDSSAAPLDATIVFTYGETVDASSAIGSAVLNVTENGEAVEPACTLEWAGGGTVKCTFADLSAGADYTVSLEGVTLLSGNSADSGGISFTTASAEAVVGEPEFKDGTLSIRISTAYASGKELMLMALKYDSQGKLIGAQILKKKVTFKGETLTISGLIGCDKIGAIVWDSFINQKPYMEMKTFDVSDK